MTEEDIKKDTDPKGNSDEPTDPSKTEDGDSTKQSEGDSDIPERFRGKSAKEIARDYIELQKALGKQGEEVKSARLAIEENKYWRQLGSLIEADPALYKSVQAQILKQSGKKADDTKQDQPKETDTRTATGNLIYERFEQRFGIDRLSDDKQTALRQKIGAEIASLLDPKGVRPARQVLDSIPLDLLPGYLEKGYKLATDGDREERTRSQALIEARRNQDAIFSDLPSSGTKSSKALSVEEKEVAKKLGMSDEEYIKNRDEE